MLHPLVQNFDGRAHRTHYSASNDSLRQFQMMEAKQVNAFVEIQQAFGEIVQPKQFFVAPVNVINGYIHLAQLFVERLPEPRANVQQREKPGRIQPASLSQSGADEMAVVMSYVPEHMQQRE